MRLTTKGRFAVTAMLDVAMYGAQSPVTLANIAERQHISLSYLEQLFGRLRRQSLVESVRGPGGGYQLAKAAEATSVAEIIHAVEEPLDSRQCGGKENCRNESRCMTHDLWEDLNHTVNNFLAGVTLSDLMARGAAMEARANASNGTAAISIVRTH
jgi:Rrf2 family transcriptional regulator, iron-sulfur cluster assembly transcription factor